MPAPIPFTRELHGGEIGLDVEGIGRALVKAGFLLDGLPAPIRIFAGMPATWRRTYGARKKAAVNAFRKVEGRKQNSVYDELLHFQLIDAEAFDAKAEALMRAAAVPKPKPAIVYPLPPGAKDYVGGLHATAGLLGNWALDWIAAPRTPILAVEDAKIAKLSGRDPNEDTWDTSGVYGWSIHYETRDGYRYFWTHFGKREPLVVGQRVLAGEKLGEIGDQRFRPDHIHGGVTSPLGESDAKKRIRAVQDAPRVKGV